MVACRGLAGAIISAMILTPLILIIGIRVSLVVALKTRRLVTRNIVMFTYVRIIPIKRTILTGTILMLVVLVLILVANRNRVLVTLINLIVVMFIAVGWPLCNTRKKVPLVVRINLFLSMVKVLVLDRVTLAMRSPTIVIKATVRRSPLIGKQCYAPVGRLKWPTKKIPVWMVMIRIGHFLVPGWFM